MFREKLYLYMELSFAAYVKGNAVCATSEKCEKGIPRANGYAACDQFVVSSCLRPCGCECRAISEVVSCSCHRVWDRETRSSCSHSAQSRLSMKCSLIKDIVRGQARSPVCQRQSGTVPRTDRLISSCTEPRVCIRLLGNPESCRIALRGCEKMISGRVAEHVQEVFRSRTQAAYDHVSSRLSMLLIPHSEEHAEPHSDGHAEAFSSTLQ